MAWRLGATVLVWPLGADTPPFLAEIDGQAWDGQYVVAHLRTESGPAWATGRVMTSATHALRAAAAHQSFRIGHC